MRKLGTAVVALGLAIAGLAVPATTAQAAPGGATASNCAFVFNQIGRDGQFRAYNLVNCKELHGADEGDDPNWADSSGVFTGSYDNDAASSLMNNGYIGGEDVVAVYRHTGYRDRDGYGCLAAGELYADYLGDNYYYESDVGQTRITMNNSISSHQWVYTSDCSGQSWIT